MLELLITIFTVLYSGGFLMACIYYIGIYELYHRDKGPKLFIRTILHGLGSWVYLYCEYKKVMNDGRE